MRPPQERPTCQAVSSATPNSSIFGLPLSITSSASAMTAPSTQPPETEPRKLPSASITRCEPTGRGAEPQVSTTVASATPRPSWAQTSASRRISSSLAIMIIPLCSHCTQPAGRIGLARAGGGERVAQSFHGAQIMDRAELVDMRQHGADAGSAGLEGLVSQKRVEPDEAAAGALQPVHLEGEIGRDVALQTVGEEQDDGPLPQHPARPESVEIP